MYSTTVPFLFFWLFQSVGGGLQPFKPTRCNLIYKNACHQYREVGNHEVICQRKPRYQLCQQTCNSASCQLQCDAPISCEQQCVAGRCNAMLCNSNSCSQSCIRGKCQLIDCRGKNCQQYCFMGGCDMLCSKNAESCIQSCEEGKCTMRCPLGVKTCEQTCKGGKCTMICHAETCKRSCDGGECTYSLKVARDLEAAHHPPRHVEYCNENDDRRAGAGTCVQRCSKGHCGMNYKYTHHSSLLQICQGGSCEFDCKAPLRCTQICTGGKCIKYLCNSKLCIQECVAGRCKMECEAETCLQTCRGGDCSMSCLSNVKECLQWCPGGNCVLGCNAKQCKRYCYSGSCVIPVEGPKLEATFRKVRCTMLTRECHQTCPPKRSCALHGWIHLRIYHSINQMCSEGDCRAMLCRTSNRCTQTCSEGACNSMSCTSNTCLQDCVGANCNMECNAKHCTQFCRGGGCKMKCTENVETCNQSCNSQISNCRTVCLAKSCSITFL